MGWIQGMTGGRMRAFEHVPQASLGATDRAESGFRGEYGAAARAVVGRHDSDNRAGEYRTAVRQPATILPRDGVDVRRGQGAS